jgi:two-component system, NarL family, sensor histidine kinase DesK
MTWRPNRGRIAGVFFSSVWLVYLGFPLAYMIGSSFPPAAKAGYVLMTLVFAGLYVTYWLRGFTNERLRWTVFGLCTVLAVLIALPVGRDNWVTPIIYVGCLAAFDPRWRRGVALAAGAVMLAGLATVGGSTQPVQAVTSMGITALSSAACFGVAGLLRANIALREAREEVSRLAVAEERLRFARDLHDLLGHSLSVIVLKAELAGRMGSRSPERAAREVADIERVARDALREVRDAVTGYRQASLSQEIESARGALEAAGVTVHLELRAGPVPTPIETTLAWAVREATTNIIRHSGARRVTIRLERADDQVELTVTDDGRGGDAIAGNGLGGLGERVAARGGTLRFGPRPGRGFELGADLPVTQSPRRETMPA